MSALVYLLIFVSPFDFMSAHIEEPELHFYLQDEYIRSNQSFLGDQLKTADDLRFAEWPHDRGSFPLMDMLRRPPRRGTSQFNMAVETNDPIKDRTRTSSYWLSLISPPERVLNKRAYESPKQDQKAISFFKMRMYPFSNVVRMSCGCIGTLLTRMHVLTAAHCLHDGFSFKENIEMIKVEVPDKMGYRIHYMAKISIPRSWLKTRNLPEVSRGAFDFAILQLNIPISRRKKFVPLSIPDLHTLNTGISFLGFQSDSYSTRMVKSTCLIDGALVAMGGNAMLSECETVAGNSGAAVFTENARTGPKIVGVLSNVISASINPSPLMSQYSSIMLLTVSKVTEICAMIYITGEEDDETCATVRKYNTLAYNTGHQRVMPFFG